MRRDVAIRYKQTVIGGAWAVLQPIALALVFTVFLSVLADVPSRAGVPYALYAFSGLVCWVFFTGAFQTSAASTVASSELITKIYFPRLLLPLAATAPSVVDVVIGFAVVVGAIPLWGLSFGPEILAVPFVLAGVWITALGAGLLFSALFVKYRDVQLVVPFVILVGLFVTPIMYPISLVSTKLQPLYALNPMVGLLEVYRWALFGSYTASSAVLPISLASAAVIVVVGLTYFQRTESEFADVI